MAAPAQPPPLHLSEPQHGRAARRTGPGEGGRAAAGGAGGAGGPGGERAGRRLSQRFFELGPRGGGGGVGFRFFSRPGPPPSQAELHRPSWGAQEQGWKLPRRGRGQRSIDQITKNGKK